MAVFAGREARDGTVLARTELFTHLARGHGQPPCSLRRVVPEDRNKVVRLNDLTRERGARVVPATIERVRGLLAQLPNNLDDDTDGLCLVLLH